MYKTWKEDKYLIPNGCSENMTWDKNKFISLKTQSHSVILSHIKKKVIDDTNKIGKGNSSSIEKYIVTLRSKI